MKNFILVILGVVVCGFMLMKISSSVSTLCGDGGCFPGIITPSSSSGASSAEVSSVAEGVGSGNIRISEPKTDAIISGKTVTIRGTARVFENQFRYRILDEDKTVIGEGPVTATSGDAGQFNPFEVTAKLFRDPQGKTGTVEAFDESAKDGSVTDLVQVPVVFSFSGSGSTVSQ